MLRLSDLRAEAPNSNYPLFIVASKDRKRRVFEELKRPTFSGPCLRLNEVIRFLGYDQVRVIGGCFVSLLAYTFVGFWWWGCCALGFLGCRFLSHGLGFGKWEP